MIVYLARNRANGKAYVGKTKRSLQQRKKEHMQAARSGADLLFSRALRKYGPDTFDWQVLVEVLSDDESALDSIERALITEYRTYVHDHPDTGYNLTLGGDGVKGLKHTPETKARMSDARKGDKNHNFGKDWGHKGPWSEETKQKMRESALGRHHTETTCAKISEALRQRVRKTRAVIQYGMDGSQIAIHASAKIAALTVSGRNNRIGDCCRGVHESHAGYRWAYAEEQKGSR